MYKEFKPSYYLAELCLYIGAFIFSTFFFKKAYFHKESKKELINEIFNSTILRNKIINNSKIKYFLKADTNIPNQNSFSESEKLLHFSHIIFTWFTHFRTKTKHHLNLTASCVRLSSDSCLQYVPFNSLTMSIPSGLFSQPEVLYSSFLSLQKFLYISRENLH